MTIVSKNAKKSIRTAFGLASAFEEGSGTVLADLWTVPRHQLIVQDGQNGTQDGQLGGQDGATWRPEPVSGVSALPRATRNNLKRPKSSRSQFFAVWV